MSDLPADWTRTTLARLGVAEHPVAQALLDELTPATTLTPLTIRNIVVGVITPAGKALHVDLFRALRPVDRLRAYLTLAAPHARHVRVISKVCGVTPNNIANFLAPDLTAGRIVKAGRGAFRAVPVVDDAGPLVGRPILACCGGWREIDLLPFHAPCCGRVYFALPTRP